MTKQEALDALVKQFTEVQPEDLRQMVDSHLSDEISETELAKMAETWASRRAWTYVSSLIVE